MPDLNQSFFHDLQTLLSIISNGSEMALMAKSDDLTQTTQVLQQNLNAARMAINLVSVRQKFGGEEFSDICGIVTRTAELIDTDPATRVSVKVPTTPIVSYNDPLPLSRILLNLAVNAHDAGKAGNVDIELMRKTDLPVDLTIGVVPQGRFVQIRVTDDGEGIPSDQLDKIWVEGFTTKGANGSGIGLPLVRRLVELHGAGLRLRSEPGQGSTVDLWWPLARKDPVEPLASS